MDNISQAELSKALARALESEAFYKSLLESQTDLISRYRPDWTFTYVNDAFCRFFNTSRNDLINKNWAPLPHPDDVAYLQAELSRLSPETPIVVIENRLTIKDGSYRWCHFINKGLFDAQGNLTEIQSAGRDIHERKLAEQLLSDSEEKYRLLISTMSEGVLLFDENALILTVNEGAEKILGLSADQLIGCAAHNLLLHSIDENGSAFTPEEIPPVRTLKTGLSQSNVVMGIQKPNGEPAWISINTTPHFNEGSAQAYRIVATIQDITERRAAESLVLRRANYDLLTQLPNRRLFQDRLEREIKKAEREQGSVALLFVDLDRFKDVNDTYGHSVGDLLLTEAAQRIQSCVRSYDTVARIGGDEFLVILPDLANRLDIERIAQGIINILREPFLIKNNELFIAASIGISVYPGDATNSIDLLKRADQAMYQAKLRGKSRFHFFTRSMQEASDNRKQLAKDLRKALSKDQLEVYYQPIVTLSDNAITKAEALLRWNHPERGQISPAVFIPIAEDTGLIFEIGDWVFEQAAIEAKKLIVETGRNFRISVNQSPLQFNNPEKRNERWSEVLSKLGLPGHNIIVEITERLLMSDDPIVIESLLQFRDANIKIAIDDFGTGYSALSYLKKFDVDYLKIDQSFVSNLALESEDYVLCEAIIVMAHKLGIKVIAEGIKTEQQRDLLRQMNCDYGQGYLFSKPLPVLEFESILKMTQKLNFLQSPLGR